MDIKSYIIITCIVFFCYSCDSLSQESNYESIDCDLFSSQDICVATSSLYDYCRNNLNPNSCNYGENIGPNFYKDQVTIHYFGHQN